MWTKERKKKLFQRINRQVKGKKGWITFHSKYHPWFTEAKMTFGGLMNTLRTPFQQPLARASPLCMLGFVRPSDLLTVTIDHFHRLGDGHNCHRPLCFLFRLTHPSLPSVSWMRFSLEKKDLFSVFSPTAIHTYSFILQSGVKAGVMGSSCHFHLFCLSTS